MEARFRFLKTLVSFVFLGFLGLALVYMVQIDNQLDTHLTLEFMPVFVIGFCNMALAFSAGECFGFLQYRFTNTQLLKDDMLTSTKIAYRALAVFFILMICFYYLRAGFNESLLERVFFTSAPLFLGAVLYALIASIYRAHFMPHWYFRLKQITLFVALIGITLANLKLFFPTTIEFLTHFAN